MVDFRQQRAIDAAILGVSDPSDRNQQNRLAELLNTPEAVTYANSAMERMGFQGSNPTQAPVSTQTSTPYDGPGITYGSQGGAGYGVTSGADLFQQLFGFQPNGGTAIGGGQYTSQLPQTYGILNPSEFGFGFGNGVPGGDVVSFLQNAGFPDVNLLQAIQQGQALGQTNFNNSAQQLGGVALPSLQSLMRLGPSGYQFLMGLYEQMLGIPEDDILYGAQQPFMGLGGAQPARQTGGYIR